MTYVRASLGGHADLGVTLERVGWLGTGLGVFVVDRRSMDNIRKVRKIHLPENYQTLFSQKNITLNV